MEKVFVLSFAVLIMLFNVSCTPHKYNNFEEALLSKSIPKISESQRQWLLALPAIMMEVNGSAHNTLEVEPFSNDATIAYKNVLSKWWGVNSRNELIDVIKSRENQGHNEIYMKLKEIIALNQGVNIGSIIQKYKMKNKVLNYYLFLNSNQTETMKTDIISWDLGRAAALIRWGYQVGYLTEV